jgi:hypothetical protein
MQRGLTDEPQGDLPMAALEPRLELRARREQQVQQAPPLQEPTDGSRLEMGGYW